MTGPDAEGASAVMEPRRRGLTLRKTVGTGMALAATQAAAGVAFLLLARRLPIGRFGAFAAIYAATSGLSTLLDFGSSQRWTRELARSGDISSYHHWLRRRTVAQLPAVVVFAIVASLVVRNDLLSNTTVVVLSLEALTSTLSIGSLAGVRALVSPARAIWFMFAGNSFFLVCVAAAPKSSLVLAAAVGASGSWLITALLGLMSTRHLARGPSRISPRNPWAGTAGFGLFGLAVALQPFDIVIVGALAGTVEAGRVSAVSKWVQPVLLLSYAYGTNAFPGLAAAKSDRDALVLLRSSIHILIAVSAICVAMFVAAPLLISVLLGPAYKDSVVLLRLLTLGCIPAAINQPCVAYLQARGQERFLAVTTLAIVGVDLAATAALARTLEAATIPIVSTAGFTVLSLILVYQVRNTRPIELTDALRA